MDENKLKEQQARKEAKAQALAMKKQAKEEKKRLEAEAKEQMIQEAAERELAKQEEKRLRREEKLKAKGNNSIEDKQNEHREHLKEVEDEKRRVILEKEKLEEARLARIAIEKEKRDEAREEANAAKLEKQRIIEEKLEEEYKKHFLEISKQKAIKQAAIEKLRNERAAEIARLAEIERRKRAIDLAGKNIEEEKLKILSDTRKNEILNENILEGEKKRDRRAYLEARAGHEFELAEAARIEKELKEKARKEEIALKYELEKQRRLKERLAAAEASFNELLKEEKRLQKEKEERLRNIRNERSSELTDKYSKELYKEYTKEEYLNAVRRRKQIEAYTRAKAREDLRNERAMEAARLHAQEVARALELERVRKLESAALASKMANEEAQRTINRKLAFEQKMQDKIDKNNAFLAKMEQKRSEDAYFSSRAFHEEELYREKHLEMAKKKEAEKLEKIKLKQEHYEKKLALATAYADRRIKQEQLDAEQALKLAELRKQETADRLASKYDEEKYNAAIKAKEKEEFNNIKEIVKMEKIKEIEDAELRRLEELRRQNLINEGIRIIKESSDIMIDKSKKAHIETITTTHEEQPTTNLKVDSQYWSIYHLIPRDNGKSWVLRRMGDDQPIKSFTTQESGITFIYDNLSGKEKVRAYVHEVNGKFRELNIKKERVSEVVKQPVAQSKENTSRLAKYRKSHEERKQVKAKIKEEKKKLKSEHKRFVEEGKKIKASKKAAKKEHRQTIRQDKKTKRQETKYTKKLEKVDNIKIRGTFVVYHILPHNGGESWRLKKSGEHNIIKSAKSQIELVQYCNETFDKNKVKVFIHDEKGKIFRYI